MAEVAPPKSKNGRVGRGYYKQGTPYGVLGRPVRRVWVKGRELGETYWKQPTPALTFSLSRANPRGERLSRLRGGFYLGEVCKNCSGEEKSDKRFLLGSTNRKGYGSGKRS